jgi:hypothetical protein
MSYGFQFITEPKFTNKKEKIPEGPATSPDDGQRPFRFSIFSRF